MSRERRGWKCWPESTWRLQIRLKVRSLDPPAVQYAVFCEDPIVQFFADLRRVKKAELAHYHRAPVRRIAQLRAVWNGLFRCVKGDEVYLLTARDDLMFMSNAPGGRKWLVTKGVQHRGQTVCWSIPFDAAEGKEVELTLTGANALDLAVLGKTRER